MGEDVSQPGVYFPLSEITAALENAPTPFAQDSEFFTF
jgi:hypothetical protein